MTRPRRHCLGCQCPPEDVDADFEGAKHSGASDTESQAARDVMPNTGTQRRKILDAFVEAWPDGFTDKELEPATGIQRYSAAPRRVELRDWGLVEDSGRRRGKGTVWIATLKARRSYGQL